MSLLTCLEKTLLVNEIERKINRRTFLVNRLKAIIGRWIFDMAKLDVTISKGNLTKISALITPFGSICMDANNVDSDTDLICIAPKHISRKLFFTELPARLQVTTGIQCVEVIENAFIPVIKFEFNEVNFDLVFVCCSNRLDVPNDLNLAVSECLKGDLDPSCLRSINGLQTMIKIVSYLPNTSHFGIALRTIKMWAQMNGIYSNVYGYFGGITWAIMLIHVFLKNQSVDAQELVYLFFETFASWNWDNPVDIEQSREQENFSKNKTGENNCICVLTPTNPRQNSTYNTYTSSRKIIEENLYAGFCCIKEIRDGKRTWDDLFQEFSILGRYVHFLAIYVCSSQSKILRKWEAIINCRIRMLAAILSVNPNIERAQILDYTLPVRRSALNSNQRLGTLWLLGIGVPKNYDKNQKIDLSEEINLFLHTANYMMTEKDRELEDRIICEYLPIDRLTKLVEAKDLSGGRKTHKKNVHIRKIMDSVELLITDIVDFVTESPIRLKTSCHRK